jgi:hypothetical protein
MTIPNNERLKRTQIRRLLRTHRGAAAELARRLGAEHGKAPRSFARAISQWLYGRKTAWAALVEREIRALADRLKAEEGQETTVNTSTTPRAKRGKQ